MDDPVAGRGADLLAAMALRITAATHLEPPGAEAVLRSIVEATAALLRSEAASLALHDPATDRLVFRVAAGDRGGGVVGLAIPSTEGVAGYVFTTGQPLAISDTVADPRFDREAAERTGFVPRSMLAVPLVDDDGAIGVLEILDRRDGSPFDLRDLETAGVFARQATVAIRASRVERDTAGLLRGALVRLAEASGGPPVNIDVEAIVGAAVEEIATDDGLWSLADEIARLRTADPTSVDLIREILALLRRRSGHDHSGGHGRGR